MFFRQRGKLVVNSDDMTTDQKHCVRARNWPRPIVRDDQQSEKDEFSSNELVLLDECPMLTIIRKD